VTHFILTSPHGTTTSGENGIIVLYQKMTASGYEYISFMRQKVLCLEVYLITVGPKFKTV